MVLSWLRRLLSRSARKMTPRPPRSRWARSRLDVEMLEARLAPSATSVTKVLDGLQFTADSFTSTTTNGHTQLSTSSPVSVSTASGNTTLLQLANGVQFVDGDTTGAFTSLGAVAAVVGGENIPLLDGASSHTLNVNSLLNDGLSLADGKDFTVADVDFKLDNIRLDSGDVKLQGSVTFAQLNNLSVAVDGNDYVVIDSSGVHLTGLHAHVDSASFSKAGLNFTLTSLDAAYSSTSHQFTFTAAGSVAFGGESIDINLGDTTTPGIVLDTSSATPTLTTLHASISSPSITVADLELDNPTLALDYDSAADEVDITGGASITVADKTFGLQLGSTTDSTDKGIQIVGGQLTHLHATVTTPQISLAGVDLDPSTWDLSYQAAQGTTPSEFTLSGDAGLSVDGKSLELHLGGTTADGQHTDGLVIRGGHFYSLDASVGTPQDQPLKLGGVTLSVDDLKVEYTAASSSTSNDDRLVLDGGATLAWEGNSLSVKLGDATHEGLVVTGGHLLSLDASVSADFDLKGLHFSVQDLTVDYDRNADTLEIYGSVSVSTGGSKKALVDVTADLGTADDPGLQLNGGHLTHLHVGLDGSFNLFGTVQVTPEHLTIVYDSTANSGQGSLTITGGLGVTVGGLLKGDTQLDNGGVSINTTTGEVDVHGLSFTFDVALGGFEIKDLHVSYEKDTLGNVTIDAGGSIQFPGDFAVGGSLEFVNGQLNEIGLTFSGNIPIGDTPLYITYVSGSIDNLTDPANLDIQATLAINLGKEMNIGGTTVDVLKVQGGIDASPQKLVLTGNVWLLNGLFGDGTDLADGTVTLTFDWTTGIYSAAATVEIFRLHSGDAHGIFTFNGSFTLTDSGDITIKGDVTARVPESIPFIGGESLGSVGFYFQLRPGEDKDQTYGAAWIDLGKLGEHGFEVTLDGSSKTLDSSDIAALGSDDGPATDANGLYLYHSPVYQALPNTALASFAVTANAFAGSSTGTLAVGATDASQDYMVLLYGNDPLHLTFSERLNIVDGGHGVDTAAGPTDKTRLFAYGDDTRTIALPYNYYEIVVHSYTQLSADLFKYDASFAYLNPTLQLTNITVNNDGTATVALSATSYTNSLIAPGSTERGTRIKLYYQATNPVVDAGQGTLDLHGVLLADLPYDQMTVQFQPSSGGGFNSGSGQTVKTTSYTWNTLTNLSVWPATGAQPSYYVYGIIEDGVTEPDTSVYPTPVTPPTAGPTLTSQVSHVLTTFRSNVVFTPKINTGISVSEPFAGTFDLLITAPTGGTLSLSDGSGGYALAPTPLTVQGVSIGLAELAGSQAVPLLSTDPTSGYFLPRTNLSMTQLNQLLDGLTFHPAVGFQGQATVTVRIIEHFQGRTFQATVSIVLIQANSNLVVSQIVDNPAPLTGSTVHLTVTVSNQAGLETRTATHVMLQELLPPGLTLTGASVSAGRYDPTTGLWAIASLAQGATATLMLTAVVNQGEDGKNFAATASATSDLLDLTPADDTSNVEIDVRQPIVVNNTGTTLNTSNDVMTLPAAIALANATPGPDRIFFNLPAGSVIYLVTNLPIAGDLDLEGPGAGVLSVVGGNGQRFVINSASTVTIDGLNLEALGIDNSGTLNVQASTISETTGNGVGGGAIYNAGTLTAIDDTLYDNQALRGGAIYGESNSTTTIVGSTLYGNSASQMGGGIYSQGTVTLGSSIVAGNHVTGTSFTDTGDLVAHVVSNGYNLIGARDGALAPGNSGAPANFLSTDLTGTAAQPLDPRLFPFGTAPYQGLSGSTPYLVPMPGSPAVDKGNPQPAQSGDERGAARVIGAASDIGAFEVQPLQAVSYTATPLPAQLAAGSAVSTTVTALDIYGHPTTFGDVVFTSSDAAAVLPLHYTFVLGDNGTHTFLVTFNTPGTPTLSLSYGDSNLAALTLQGFTVERATIDVTTLADVSAPTDGTVSLREAIAQANATAGHTTIDFAVGGTITLAQGPLTLSGDVTVSGPFKQAVTLSGANLGRIFVINQGATVELDHLTLSDGVDNSDGGGAILNNGTLTINASTLHDNATFLLIAPLSGQGTLSAVAAPGSAVTNLTLVQGVPVQGVIPPALPSGGAILNNGVLTIENSTLYNNTTGGNGGTLDNRGTATVDHSTLYANTAGAGSGLANDGGTLNLLSSIVAGGREVGAAADVSGAVVSKGYNLIGDASDSTGWIGSDLLGTPNAPLDPLLSAPQDNGGPTWTMLPQNGSPVIDAGDPTPVAVTDQRGGVRLVGAQSDIGAVEVQPGAATQLVIISAAQVAAGTALSVTVSTLDVLGHVATSYRGTVSFSSTDAKAQLPAPYTFSSADAGTHTFSILLATAGSQTLTVSDAPILTPAPVPQLPTGLTNIQAPVTPSGSGSPGTSLPGPVAPAAVLSVTSPAILVTPGAAASLVVSGLPATMAAGLMQAFTLTVEDAFGNVVTGFAQTVSFSSSDSHATLPADYTFTAADGGVHSFTVAFATAGQQSLTIAQVQTVAVTGLPPGTPPGAPPGFPPGLPSDSPPSLPSDSPPGLPSGSPPGPPSGPQSGSPSGLPQGSPSGLPQGSPPGLPGSSPGLPPGPPPGLPPGSLPDALNTPPSRASTLPGGTLIPGLQPVAIAPLQVTVSVNVLTVTISPPSHPTLPPGRPPVVSGGGKPINLVIPPPDSSSTGSPPDTSTNDTTSQTADTTAPPPASPPSDSTSTSDQSTTPSSDSTSPNDESATPPPQAFTQSPPTTTSLANPAPTSAPVTETSTPAPTVSVHAVVYVNAAWAGLPQGTDPDGSGPATALGVDAFASIQQAVNAVAAGGTVNVAAGSYAENVVLSGDVTLHGSGSAGTILAGSGAGSGLAITAGSAVQVSGLTVRGYEDGLVAGPAVGALTLTDVRLTGNAFGGSVTGVAKLTVGGNRGGDTFFVTPRQLARQGDNPLTYAGVGSLTIDAVGGSNRMEVFLNDTPAPATVWINANGMTRTGSSFLLFYRTSGGNFGGGIDVILGNGNNTVVVQGQPAGAPTRIYGGSGDDTFDVAVTSASAYQGLTIDGNGGNDTLSVFDGSGNAALMDVPGGDGSGHVEASYLQGTNSRIDYQNLGQVWTDVDPETAFLRSVYHQELGREAAAGDLAYWLPVLEASGQQAVSAGIAQSEEALRHAVQTWFGRYLGFAPTDVQLSFWEGQLALTSPEATLSQLLASDAYGQKAGGGDAGFVRQLYQDLLQRQPTATELQTDLAELLPNIGRAGLAWLVLTSDEFHRVEAAG